MNTVQQAGYPVIASVARQSRTPCVNRKITGLPRWLRLLAMTGGTVNHENGTASYEDRHCERSAAIAGSASPPCIFTMHISRLLRSYLPTHDRFKKAPLSLRKPGRVSELGFEAISSHGRQSDEIASMPAYTPPTRISQ